MFSTPLDEGILDRLDGSCLCSNQIHPEVSVIFMPNFFEGARRIIVGLKIFFRELTESNSANVLGHLKFLFIDTVLLRSAVSI